MMHQNCSSSKSSSSTAASSTLTSLILQSLFGKNDNMTVDRALGAAATLGFSMAILRLVSSTFWHHRTGGGGGGETPSSYEKIILLSLFRRLKFLRSFLTINRRLEKGRHDDTSTRTKGDAYFTAAYNQSNANADTKDDENEDEIIVHRGCCHCGSIQFMLNAPRKLKACDSPGKIRYPSIITTATNFQLTSGTQHIGVYYVALPSSSSYHLHNNNSHHHGSSLPATTTAAHTFCKRCGVPILRAPDSQKNNLEVNANCFDDDIMANVSFEDDDEKGLAAGFPIPDQWAENDGSGGGNVMGRLMTPPPSTPRKTAFSSGEAATMMNYHARDLYTPDNSMKESRNFPQDPPTPMTLSTSTCNSSVGFYSCRSHSNLGQGGVISSRGGGGGGCSSPTLFDQAESSSIESTSSSGGIIETATSSHLGIGNWAVGSSLRSSTTTTTMHHHRSPISGSPSPRRAMETTKNSIDLPIMRDQLKYYMRKHLDSKKIVE